MGRAQKSKTHKDCSPKEDLLARTVALTTKTLGQAYQTAGYSSKVAVPRVQAMKVLNRVHVAERVEYYKAMMAAKLDIRAERVMAEFAAIAFMDPIDVFDINDGVMTVRNLDDIPPWARRAIASIKQKRTIDTDLAGKETETIELEVKFHPKVQALTKIAEVKNMFKDHEKNKKPRVNIDISFQGAR